MAEHDVKVDYSQITEQIYVGSNSCCVVHFKDQLLTIGIRGDISLEKEQVDNPLGVDFFLWLPVDDDKAPTDEQFELGIKTLDFFTKNNIKVYVHCRNGHGRAPTLVAGYFINQGMTAEQAIKKIADKRPEIHLDDGQVQALSNLPASTAVSLGE